MHPLKLAITTSALVVAAMTTPQDSSAMLLASQWTGAYLVKAIFGINI
jgi:hypothetical protein